MALRNRIKWLVEIVKCHEKYLKRNAVLLDIFSGRLLPYLNEALERQLQGESLKQARERIAPINVLSRIVAKQSGIYTPGVSRQVTGGTSEENDRALLTWYERAMRPSLRMHLSNKYFNLFRNSLIWPCLDKANNPRLRIYPSDRFIPFTYSSDSEDKPDGVVLTHGTMKWSKGKTVNVYQAADAESFCFFTEEGDDVTAVFAPGTDGEHDLGRAPFTYINSDPNNVIPIEDTDVLAMTVLLPVLLTDINFAHMFAGFGVLYGINLNDNGLTMSPNAFWNFSTEPGTDKQATIGSVKSELDISGGLELVANQFALWLNTKGIKPGAIGEISGSNFSSGISKIMDEMDTSENRNEQVPFFQEAETDLWDLVLKGWHPIWSKTVEGFKAPKIEMSKDASVTANFAEQVPLVRRGQVVSDAKNERDAGFTTHRDALKRINPTFTEEQIDELTEAIRVEKDAASATGAQSLNGAQVSSMVDVLGRVALGILPPESAKALLRTAFGVTPEAVDEIVNPITPGSVTPEQAAAAK